VAIDLEFKQKEKSLCLFLGMAVVAVGTGPVRNHRMLAFGAGRDILGL
jgi:hypothetical protein